MKQPTWLVCRHVALKSAEEGSWHVFSSKLGMREEEAAIIELRKFFVSCLGLSGLQRGLRSAKFSGWPCPMWRLPSSVAQEPLLEVTFQHFNSFLRLFFWVAEAFLLACVFMRICLTQWALMAGTPFGPCFQKSIAAAGPLPRTPGCVHRPPRQAATAVLWSLFEPIAPSPLLIFSWLSINTSPQRSPWR